MGYPNVNILAMMKQADSKVPIKKVLPMTKALLEQYWTGHLNVIDQLFGLVISANERRIIKVLRAVTDDRGPAFDPVDLERALRAFKRRGWLSAVRMP